MTIENLVPFGPVGESVKWNRIPQNRPARIMAMALWKGRPVGILPAHILTATPWARDRVKWMDHVRDNLREWVWTVAPDAPLCGPQAARLVIHVMVDLDGAWRSVADLEKAWEEPQAPAPIPALRPVQNPGRPLVSHQASHLRRHGLDQSWLLDPAAPENPEKDRPDIHHLYEGRANGRSALRPPEDAPEDPPAEEEFLGLEDPHLDTWRLER